MDQRGNGNQFPQSKIVSYPLQDFDFKHCKRVVDFLGTTYTFSSSLPLLSEDANLSVIDAITRTRANAKPVYDINHELMSTSAVLIGLVLGTICTATTASNILVFVAVAYSKHLRTVSNIFIVSLSAADMLVATVVMVPATLSQVYGQWVLTHEFCLIWASCDVMLCSASVLNVCAISFDRYLAIISPLRYKSLMTFRRALLLLAVLWIVSVLSSFVPITNGWHNYEGYSLVNLTLSSEEPQCVLRVSLPYALLAGSITLMIPIIIALVFYFKVSEEAKRQAMFVRTLIAPSRVLLGQDVTSKSVREPFTRKATITLGVIVGAYVVTWTPFLIANVIDAYCKCVPPKIFASIVWLGYCNSLINPIIYPLLMRDFRKVYGKMFMMCCPRLNKLRETSKEIATRGCDKSLASRHSNNGVKTEMFERNSNNGIKTDNV